jgi:hypothetical protein
MAPLAATRASVPPLERRSLRPATSLPCSSAISGEAGCGARSGRIPVAPDPPRELPRICSATPDIRAAEANLHQTNARIGVAQALMFRSSP